MTTHQSPDNLAARSHIARWLHVIVTPMGLLVSLSVCGVSRMPLMKIDVQSCEMRCLIEGAFWQLWKLKRALKV